MISENEAIKLAYPVFQKSILASSNRNVTAVQNRLPWPEVSIAHFLEDPYFTASRLALKDKKYWAVDFAPTRGVRGGDLTVFIDSWSGEVLTHVAGR